MDRLAKLRAHAADLEDRMLRARGGTEYANLSGRYQDALKQIDDIEQHSTVGKASAVDEIAARRKRRRKPIKDGKAREA